MTVRDFLKKLIAEGWKQKDIATKCGYKPAMINGLLLRVEKASIQTIERIAVSFNVPITVFLEEGEGRKERILSMKEETLLEIIGNDQDVLDKMIEYAEKEKIYLEAKGRGKQNYEKIAYGSRHDETKHRL